MTTGITSALVLGMIGLFSGMVSGTIPDADTVNTAIEISGAQWTAGQGSFTRWTEAELQSLTGGILPEPRAIQVMDPISLWSRHRDLDTLPDAHDWRDYQGVDWMTPVKNQAGCGACAAFASVGCVEALIRIAGNMPDLAVDLSEQHLFSCCNGDCPTGLYMGTAFDYFRDSGVPDEACLPYSAVDDNCDSSCSDWQERVEQISGWDLLWQYNSDDAMLKSIVYDQPVACYMEVFGDFMSYNSGVYEHVTGSLRGGHFVVIVGWNDAEDCWICKNSWGTDWGEDGYFRIKRGETEIGTWAMVPSYESAVVTPTPRPTATPTPVLELGITLKMPGKTFTPGDVFYLDAAIGNPGMTISGVPVCILLESGSMFWCWPEWKALSEGIDYRILDVPLGISTIHAVPKFEWPNIPPAGVELFFWGVMLDPGMTGILGNYDRISWGY